MSAPTWPQPRSDIRFRLASAADLAAVQRFYEANAHQYFAFRRESLRRLVASDQLLIATLDGRIRAAAGIECHDLTDGTSWWELIQARVTSEAAGGYQLLVALRVAMIASRAFRPVIFCEVDEVNERVKARLTRLGFVRLDPPEELRVMSVDSLPPDKRPGALGYEFEWLHLPAPQAVSMLHDVRLQLLGPDMTRTRRADAEPAGALLDYLEG